jgi:hypothetical protein
MERTDDVGSALWAWLESLPDWQSDLMRRLIEKGALEEADVESVARSVIEHSNGSPSSAAVRLQRKQLPAAASTRGSVRLAGIRDVRLGRASLLICTTST